MKRRNWLALAITLASSSAAGASESIMIVTPRQLTDLGIVLGNVRAASREPIAQLPATIIPAVNARTAATAPFPGTVLRTHVLPGQTVQSGAPIATVASRELLDTLSQLAQAEAELQAAQAVAQRRRMLANKNIYSPSLAEESEAQAEKIRAVIEKHRRATRIGGITLGPDGQYTIHAPVSGRIVDVHAMAGEKLDAMAAVATIDAGDKLWMEAHVPVALIRDVSPGDKVQVAGGPEGVVVAVGGTIDNVTRSARLLAELPAGSGLTAGQIVAITLTRPTVTGALEVPASAVTWISDRHAVFLRRDDGFALVAVMLRGRAGETATVTGELSAGAVVAAAGLPLLEAMLESK